MTEERITSLLKHDVPCRVHVFSSLASTNTTLHEMARAGAPEGTAVIACTQTAGRGRLGREFSSPEGAGLYMSLLLRRDLPDDRVPLLTPYAALAAAEAVEATAEVTVGIKWVNDLRIGEAKIAGILTEGEFTPDGHLAFAVVGIGVNLTSGALPPHLAGIAAAIGDTATPPEADVLAAAILDVFFDRLPTLLDSSFLEDYRRRSVVLGRRVTATVGEQTLEGVAEAIGDDGALLVRTASGERRLRAGEVSIKL